MDNPFGYVLTLSHTRPAAAVEAPEFVDSTPWVHDMTVTEAIAAFTDDITAGVVDAAGLRAIAEQERSGKARSTLLTWLDEQAAALAALEG